jgi:hypothetical protein
VVAFLVGGGFTLYTDAFRQISSRHGILFLDEVETAIINAEGQGIVIRAGDKAHWNETGHRIAGEVLVNYLRQLCLVDGCRHLPHKKNGSHM